MFINTLCVHNTNLIINLQSLTIGYRDYGHDIDNLDTLHEVGLGFTADLKKHAGFVGDRTVQLQKQELQRNKGR